MAKFEIKEDKKSKRWHWRLAEDGEAIVDFQGSFGSQTEATDAAMSFRERVCDAEFIITK